MKSVLREAQQSTSMVRARQTWPRLRPQQTRSWPRLRPRRTRSRTQSSTADEVRAEATTAAGEVAAKAACCLHGGRDQGCCREASAMRSPHQERRCGCRLGCHHEAVVGRRLAAAFTIHYDASAGHHHEPAAAMRPAPSDQLPSQGRRHVATCRHIRRRPPLRDSRPAGRARRTSSRVPPGSGSWCVGRRPEELCCSCSCRL